MFRRGFKSWAEESALRLRRELKLQPTSPIDPAQVAQILGVPVLTPEELTELACGVRGRLLTRHSDTWSAITVSVGKHHLIVMNPEHPHTRRNSSLAHELAHILLGHDPSMMFVTPNS